DRECRQVARDNHSDHRRAGLRAERELLRLVDELLERGGWRLDALLLQQRLVVEEADGRGAEGNSDQLAADRHRRDESRRDVAEILDRRLGAVVIQRLEQRRHVWYRAAVHEEADAEIGTVEARLAEEAVLQRVRVERRPDDFGVVRLTPRLGEIAV